jgi:pyridoxine 5-phosphate synthase
MTPIRLYVNVDHVATVREARRTDEPDPFEAALQCQAAGADGITVHLREDRRHIQDRDVERLAPGVKVLNLELATSPDVVDVACRLRPYQATVVP